MAHHEIVAHLLRLSSEAESPDGLLKAAVELIAESTKADAVAIAGATLPEWTVIAARNTSPSSVPTELAADSLERGQVVGRDRWLAAPLTIPSHEPESNGEVSRVLMLRGTLAGNVAAEIGAALA